MLTVQPSSPVSRYLHKEMKTHVHKKTCTRVCTSALVARVENWKQCKCPSPGDWIYKWQFIHTMQHCIAITKSRKLVFGTTELNFTNVMLTERTIWFCLHEILEQVRLYFENCISGYLEQRMGRGLLSEGPGETF